MAGKRINSPTAPAFHFNVSVHEARFEQEFVVDFTAKFLHKNNQ